MNWKNQKYLIQSVFVLNATLKMMVHKIGQYFSQWQDILKGFLVLVMIDTFITFFTGNLNDCLMKKLILLKHLIIALFQTQIIMVLKEEQRLIGAFNYGKVVNIYIVHEINISINISDYPTLENCLFGAVRFTKNADIKKYKYSRYGIGFDRKGS